MAINWDHTHAAWKKLKSANKRVSFPDSGAGKALDKAEALYKKIDWDDFEPNPKMLGDVALQDFLKLHAAQVNPFMRAVDAACDLIKKTKGMPRLGTDFADEMETSAGAFGLKEAYFSGLLGQYKSAAQARQSLGKFTSEIDKKAGMLGALPIKEVIKNIKTRLMLFEAAEKAHDGENVLFLSDVCDKKPGKYIVDTYIRPGSKEEINISAPDRNGIVAAYDAPPPNPKKNVDFSAAVRAIEYQIGINGTWRNAVDAWKAEEYKKLRKKLGMRL
jgi:hypothetical protein